MFSPSALEYVYVEKRSIIGNVSMALGLTLGGKQL
jgi:hypothetical protein